MPTNTSNTNTKNISTNGFSMNAGFSPESITYSVKPKMAKNIKGTLTQDGIRFFMI